MVDWTFKRKGKMMAKIILIMLVLASGYGCSQSRDKVNWRKDTGPVTRRVPVLSACTNMQWHGEIMSKDSLFSVPGPSAYRIVCYIPNASQLMSDIGQVSFNFHCVEDPNLLNKEEIERLYTDYGVKVNVRALLMNEEFTAKVIMPPYWGKCVYFKEQQLLCIVMYGER